MPLHSIVFSVIAMIAALLVIGVAHESGHFLAARWLRIPVRRVTFGHGPILWRRSLGRDSEFVLRAVPTGMAIGVPGRRDPDGTMRRPLSQDVLLAVGGPVASFVFAGVLLAAAQIVFLPLGFQYWLTASALLSVALAVANLIPLPGLDGGHLLLLGLARLGIQLSPQRELRVQRLGVNLLAAGCLVVLGIALARRL
jgi:membrane-associated protease RseP (regulator of RpoE activity)